MEVVHIKKILLRNLLIYIGLHCVRRSSWTVTTLATLTYNFFNDFALTVFSNMCVFGTRKLCTYVKAVLFLDVFNFLKKMFQVAILVNINVILENVLTTLLFVIKLWTAPMIIQMKETVLRQVRLFKVHTFENKIQRPLR